MGNHLFATLVCKQSLFWFSPFWRQNRPGAHKGPRFPPPPHSRLQDLPGAGAGGRGLHLADRPPPMASNQKDAQNRGPPNFETNPFRWGLSNRQTPFRCGLSYKPHLRGFTSPPPPVKKLRP